MFPVDQNYIGVDSVKLACPPDPPPAGLGDRPTVPGQLGLVVMRSNLGSRDVRLRVSLPWRTPIRLAVYDIAGRRVKTLVDKELPAGITEIRWTGDYDAGRRVVSGMYFIRLSCAEGARVSKVVILR